MPEEEGFFSPDEGYSTPPEELAAGSPQSFSSVGSSQAEHQAAMFGRAEGASQGGSYPAEHPESVFGQVEGTSQGSGYPAVAHAPIHERDQEATGGALQAGEPTVGYAVTRCLHLPDEAHNKLPCIFSKSSRWFSGTWVDFGSHEAF